MANIKDKVVWLTGASSGIGESLARELARRGAKLAITARTKEKLDKIASELNQQGCNVTAFAADVTKPAEINACVKEITQSLGDVEVLITNAGTYKPTEPETFNAEEYNNIMKLNFSAMLFCIEAVLPKMLEKK